MAGLTVTFGNGGASTVFDLQSIDAQNNSALDNSTQKQEVTDQNGSILQSGSVNVGVAPVSGSGTGGDVAVNFDANTNSFNFDVVGKWNSVKNVLAQSDSAENVYFKDFVQADVHLGGTTASTVEILNVKRANVSTGSGNDTVTISLLSNDKNWVNAATVDTGAGNDTITIKAGQGLNAIGGITGANAVNGGNGITDGSNSSVIINAGAGDDTIDLHGVNLKSSTVTGGTGVDHMIASGGADTFVFNLGDMAKSFITDTIEGFNTAVDKLKLVGTVESDWQAQTVDGDAIIKYIGAEVAHQGEKIILSNVDAGGFHNWFTA
ncbi:rhizobiocin [Rhizobium sp. WYJ-E13]|uniref:rhizobiocin n=1 Tax=Rhizobium sp. WYJ-E13 TaxID=2849093 RepID=UPI001C1EF4C6|nr:rhizobiocin [Rhizobium sp. WYJ-E13]QWW71926.1 rhizobiocin [Rhizobium sp. WYJ-E13]